MYDLLKQILNKSGICILSAKRYYFGLGGGIQTLKDYNSKYNIFNIEDVRTYDDGASNIRDIIILRFNN